MVMFLKVHVAVISAAAQPAFPCCIYVQLLPVLLPNLLSIINSPASPLGIQRRVMSILHGVLAPLGHIQGAYQRKVSRGVV